MAKKITHVVKSQILAGKASPANLGSTLGPTGVSIMEFCKAFNAKTQSMEPESPVPVVINIYADRSFTFITKKPPVSFYIKKFSNVKSGSKEPGKAFVGKIKKSDIKKIAEAKIEDMNANNLEAAERMIIGSAFSMGIEVIEG